MGSNDIPPDHVPIWLIPVATALLGISAVCWCVTYRLITLETLRTHVYGMPIPALVVNVAWEAVYFSLAVSDAAFLEAVGIFLWLVFDIDLLFVTLLFLSNTRAHFSKACANAPTSKQRQVLTAAFVIGLVVLATVCHWAFATWWLSTPGHGCGDKTGKFWQGQEGYDTTEPAFWTASVCQLVTSVSSLTMLWGRQDGRGASMPALVWRTAGSVIGLGLANGMLWWYWPEAHCYFSQPLAIFLNGTSLVCDLAYGYVLLRICTVAETPSAPGEDRAHKQDDMMVPMATNGASTYVGIRRGYQS